MEKLQELTIPNGYRTTPLFTGLATPIWSVDELPALSVFPHVEDAQYKASVITHIMPVSFDFLNTFNIATENPTSVSEVLLGDIIHCILGPTFALHFTNGSSPFLQGNIVKGAISGATGVVMSVTVTSGAYLLGNAAGTLRIRDQRGYFTAEDLKLFGGTVVKAKSTGFPVIQDFYEGLVDNIVYVSGGVQDYPDQSENVILVKTVFNFIYSTLNDNPYLQP
jgi:hypothetical protein